MQERHQRIANRLAELRETSHNEVKRLEEVMQEANAYAETILETVREHLVVLDGDLRVVSANRSFYQTFQASPEETEGHLIYELGNHQWDIPRLRVLLEEMLPKDTKVEDFEVDHEFPTIGRRAMLINAHRISRNNEGTPLILLALEDITERKRAEEDLRSLMEFNENVVQSIQDGLVVFDQDLRITIWNNAMEEISGSSADEILGKVASEVFPHLIEQGVDELLKAALAGQDAAMFNLPHKTMKGEVRRTNERYLPIRSPAGDVIRVLAIVEDVTEVLRLKVQAANLEEEFKEPKLIDIAKGILTKFGLSEAEGYQFIQKRSLDKKIKIEEVAMQVIDLFEFPEEQKI